MRARWLVLLVSAGCASLSGLDALQIEDGGADATVDVGADAAPDSARSDASVASDASDASHANDASDASDGGKAAGIPCGTNKACSGLAPVCCVTVATTYSYQCVASAASCAASNEIPISCGSSADCPGATCCGFPNGPLNPNTQCANVTTASKVQCSATCNASLGEFEVGCSVQSQNCSVSGKTCITSQCTLPGYTLCN